MSFIKRGDGKIIGIVKNQDAESKKSDKQASESTGTSENDNKESQKSGS